MTATVASAQFLLTFNAADVAGSGNTLYAVTRDGQLLRTGNAGSSWTPAQIVASGEQPELTQVESDPTNARTVWAATLNQAGGGVFRSTDGGLTWSLATSGLPATGELTDLATVRGQGGVVYARIANQVFKTTDGGLSWQLQGKLPGTGLGVAFEINPVHPEVWYFIPKSNPFVTTVPVFRTRDEGKTWTQPSTFIVAGRPDNIPNGVFAVASSPQDPNIVFTGQYGPWGGLHDMVRSVDGGSTWTTLNRTPPAQILVDFQGNVFYTNSIHNSTTGPGSYFRSGNNGTTFTELRVAMAGDRPLFRLDLVQPGVLLAATTSGIYRSTNNGLSFTHLLGETQGTLDLPASVELHSVSDVQLTQPVPLRFKENADWEAPFTASLATATGGEWLTLGSASGTIPDDSLQLMLDTTGLVPGTYTATITITCNFECAGSPHQLPVNLTLLDPADVVAPPFLISTVAGGPDATIDGDGVQAATARLTNPEGIALDTAGRLLIVDSGSSRIRRVATNGVISTVAGTGVQGASQTGPATATPLASLGDIAAMPDGGFVFEEDFRLRHVSPAGVLSSVGTVRVLGGIATDRVGNIYVAYLGSIRRIDPDGTVTTLATGFDSVRGIAVDRHGNVYVTEGLRQLVLKISPDGAVTTVAGSGAQGYNGDGIPAVTASLFTPSGVGVDDVGNVYFAERTNDRIRMVDLAGTIHTIAGAGEGYSGDGGPASEALLDRPQELFVTPDGIVYFSSAANDTVRNLTPVRPSIFEGGVVNAASNLPTFSPGSLLTAYGDFPGVVTAGATTAPWPLTLGGLRATLNGRPMPLSYGDSGQMNGQIPYETELGIAVLVIYVNGIPSAEYMLQIEAASPGIIQFGDNRAVAVNPNGRLNTADAPVAPGGTVVVYLVGLGDTDVAVATGAAAPLDQYVRPSGAASVLLGDRAVAAGFLGLTPGSVGLAQLNLTIPADLPDGDYAIKITIGGKVSNGPVITVRR